ncbi:cardiolipin synthase, partial [Enterococcus faecium]
YSLNFEVSTFIYNPDIAWMFAQVFEEDIEKSVLLTDEIMKQQGYWLRFKQNVSRLLSPVL